MNSFFKQLYNNKGLALITIDSKEHSFAVTVNEDKQSIRLNKTQFLLLLSIIKAHPNYISYDDLQKLLKSQKIALPDITRLHRKMSELKTSLKELSPCLKDFIQNIRGVGYGITVGWALPNHSLAGKPIIKNQIFKNYIDKLETMLLFSNEINIKANIIRQDDSFILDRSPFKEKISSIVREFNELEEEILKAVKLHKEDFLYIRLQAYLANFRTFLTLCRKSEYQIDKATWNDWFKTEAEAVLNNIIQILKNI